MVNGVTGRPGRNAVSRVVEEHKIVLELAPIPRQNMVAKTAVEKAKKSVHAMTFHAQVNHFRLSIEHKLSANPYLKSNLNVSLTVGTFLISLFSLHF